MKFDPQKHHRRSTRIQGYDYTRPGGYFVTIVTQGRACLFGEVVGGEVVLNEAGKMVSAAWAALPERFPHVELGIFVVMPNHFHGILLFHDNPVGATLVVAPDLTTIPDPPTLPPNEGKDVGRDLPLGAAMKSGAAMKAAPTLGRVVGAFKSITTHEYIGGVHRSGWMPFDQRLWQRNYYEHILRNAEDANRVHRYIHSNPAAWTEDRENPAHPV